VGALGLQGIVFCACAKRFGFRDTVPTRYSLYLLLVRDELSIASNLSNVLDTHVLDLEETCVSHVYKTFPHRCGVRMQRSLFFLLDWDEKHKFV
jgi:hypothetical protein